MIANTDSLNFTTPEVNTNFLESESFAKTGHSLAIVITFSFGIHILMLLGVLPKLSAIPAESKTIQISNSLDFALVTKPSPKVTSLPEPSNVEPVNSKPESDSRTISSANGSWQLTDRSKEPVNDPIKDETEAKPLPKELPEEALIEARKVIEEPNPVTDIPEALPEELLLPEETIEPVEPTEEQLPNLEFSEEAYNALSTPPHTELPAKSHPAPTLSAAELNAQLVEEKRLNIQSSIGQVAVYPALALKRGIQGTVTLAIQFDEEGKFNNVSVSKSSGYSVLDKAAMKTTKKALKKEKDSTLADQTLEIQIVYQLQ